MSAGLSCCPIAAFRTARHTAPPRSPAKEQPPPSRYHFSTNHWTLAQAKKEGEQRKEILPFLHPAVRPMEEQDLLDLVRFSVVCRCAYVVVFSVVLRRALLFLCGGCPHSLPRSVSCSYLFQRRAAGRAFRACPESVPVCCTCRRHPDCLHSPLTPRASLPVSHQLGPEVCRDGICPVVEPHIAPPEGDGAAEGNQAPAGDVEGGRVSGKGKIPDSEVHA